MNLFSISQLGRYSGIKPHTIRAWEKRYKAFRPNRSTGNTRYYDSKQLRRLLNISSLLNSGYKVSELCGMTDEKLHQLMENFFISSASETEEYFISQLIAAALSYDEVHFEKIFSHCLLRYKLKNTYLLVLMPMLVRIGLMWKCDKASATHEHFISNLLRQKLFTAVDCLPPASSGAEKWMLFLPENEFHELGLLLAYNLIRLSGQKAVYLGPNVPWGALKNAAQEIMPDRILFFMIHHDATRSTQKYIADLTANFAGSNIYGAGDFKFPKLLGIGKKFQWLQSVEDLTGILTAN
jgi:MerR family transcriptional regulator, light-induced transcriptional regulator